MAPLAADTLFDWAELSYPVYFPSHRKTQSFEQYTFRFYPETASFVAVADSSVYVLGPLTGNQIVRVGWIEDFRCLVEPSSCPATAIHALALITPPAAVARLGEPLPVAPAVQLLDSQGGIAALAGVEVSVSVSGPCATLKGASARTDASGRAVFAGLSIGGAALARRLTFSAPGSSAAESGVVHLMWGPAVATEAVSARCFGALGDGLADDAPAIQSALDSISIDGGTVLLPAGTYMLGTSAGNVSRGANDQVFPNGRPIESALIVRADKLTFLGDGSKTVLKLMSGKKLRVLTVDHASDVALQDFVADGNRAQRDGSQAWPGADVVDALVYGNVTTRLTMRGLETLFGLEDGIGIWQSRGTLVDNCYSHDNGLPSVGGTGVSMSGGANVVMNSRFERNTSTAVWLAYGFNEATVRGNSIRDNLGAGITIGGLTQDLGAGNNINFTITDNVIERNGLAGFPAIHVLAASNGSVTQNQIIDNPFAGVSVLGKSSIQLRDNRIENNGSSIKAQVEVEAAAQINADWATANTLRWAAPPAGADRLPPQGSLDLPAPGSIVSGLLIVAGWAFDSTGLDRVDVLIDGAWVGSASLHLPRQDVAKAVPGAPADSGFQFTIDTTRTPNGAHVLGIRAVDTSGNTLDRTVSVTILNASAVLR